MMKNKPSHIKMYYHPWKNRKRGKNTTGPHHTQKSSGIRKGRLPPISHCFKARPSGARSLSTETSMRQRRALCTRRDPGSPTRSPASAGRKLAHGSVRARPRRERAARACAHGSVRARPRRERATRACARRVSIERRRSPREAPPLQAAALGYGQGSEGCGSGTRGPASGLPESAPPCPHAVAAPSARGSGAARPGGTWLPASQTGLEGPWASPARPRGRRPSPSGSSWPPPGPGSPLPSPRRPRRCPRQGTARPEERGCGSRAPEPVLELQPGVLPAQPRVLPVPIVPRADGLQMARRQVSEPLLQLLSGAARTASPAHAAAAPTNAARAAWPASVSAAFPVAAAPAPGGATAHAPHRSGPSRAAGVPGRGAALSGAGEFRPGGAAGAAAEEETRWRAAAAAGLRPEEAGSVPGLRRV